jgi:SPP1 family predicted phage head-tail adaptor
LILVDVNKYKNRIIIEKAGLTSNGMGGYVKVYATRCTVWASVIPLAGAEGMRYKQVYPTATYKVSMRYRSDIDTDCRVKYYHQMYNILSVVDVDNAHEELILMLEVRPDEN